MFIHRQVRALVDLGLHCEILVYRPAPPPPIQRLFRPSWVRHYWHRLWWRGDVDGIPVHWVFYERDWSPAADEVPAVGKALVALVRRARIHADVVYAHWLWPGAAASLNLRRELELPVVAIARGSEMHDWMERRPHCRAWVERVLAEADVLLANCEDLRTRAEALLPGSAARMRVIYNGCDATVFKPSMDRQVIRRSLGWAEVTRVLLFCGDITERKGMPELATAWRTFAKRHTDWRLVIVGRPVDRSLSQTMRSLDRVFLMGSRPQREIVRYMQAADGYVQPSRLEGLANATMEAMAVGLPVVTTDTCGQRELVVSGENGVLVPVADPVRLERALEELAADEARARGLGIKARQTIESRFDPRKHAARLASILRDAAQR